MSDQTQEAMKNAQTYTRVKPQSDLDFNLMITETLWGSNLVSPDLQDALTQKFQMVDGDGKQVFNETGQPIVTERAAWGLLSFYTRDLRLSNLSYKSGEIQYCQHYLDLAGDFLKEKMVIPFLICLSRVATVSELAQSKGGFLRKQMNTLRMESSEETLDPAKKSILGGFGGGRR